MNEDPATKGTSDLNRTLKKLVEQIGRLSPGQRRLLYRQLNAMGLLEAEVLLSDRNPLPIALAVPPENVRRKQRQDAVESGKPEPPRPAVRPKVNEPLSPDGGPTVASLSGQEIEAQTATPNAHGKTPTDPIQIVFDGGSRGNPGQGYGSFALDWPGYPREIVQLEFGDKVTNNEAEYDTLIAALEAVRDRMMENELEIGSAILGIWGDSLLVCNQVRGEWKCKEPRLQARLEKVKELLSSFGESELNHQPREKSVEILGH